MILTTADGQHENQFVHVDMVSVNRLKLMSRKQTDQVCVYKPLGVLKRTMVQRPTYGEINMFPCAVTPVFLRVYV